LAPAVSSWRITDAWPAARPRPRRGRARGRLRQGRAGGGRSANSCAGRGLAAGGLLVTGLPRLTPRAPLPDRAAAGGTSARRRPTVVGGPVQGRPVVIVARVQVRARLDQRLDHLGVALGWGCEGAWGSFCARRRHHAAVIQSRGRGCCHTPKGDASTQSHSGANPGAARLLRCLDQGRAPARPARAVALRQRGLLARVHVGARPQHAQHGGRVAVLGGLQEGLGQLLLLPGVRRGRPSCGRRWGAVREGAGAGVGRPVAGCVRAAACRAAPGGVQRRARDHVPAGAAWL
jgi:hypothetical protein